MRFNYPTGTPEAWKERGLADAKLPLATFGTMIRAHQKDFVKKALAVWEVPENPQHEPALKKFAEDVRKQWGASKEKVPLDTHEDLADFLSELLYRMSVTHTNTHHHPICHATMPNGRVFPFQLARGSTGDVYPSSDHHTATMIIWDMGTEPMPHMDFPLHTHGSFGNSNKTRQHEMEHLYSKYMDQLMSIEHQVHDYNRHRCDKGNYEQATGCTPYSCVIPRELLMSFGI